MAPGATGARARGTMAPRSERAMGKCTTEPTALDWMEATTRGHAKWYVATIHGQHHEVRSGNS